MATIWSLPVFLRMLLALTSIFIVGAPRTGSSMLLMAIKAAFGLPGHGEGHFVPAIARVFDVFDEIRDGVPTDGTMIGAVKPMKLEAVLLSFIRKRYALEFPEGSWVDKTPSPAAVRTVPWIYKAFPDAKVICTRRSGLEVVQSAMTKFGMDIQGACATWLGPMHALIELQDRKVPLLEVEHRNLLELSMPALSAISEHIGAGDKSAALRDFVRTRFFEATHGAPKRFNSLDQMPWTDEQKRYFETHCKVVMTRFGYSF